MTVYRNRSMSTKNKEPVPTALHKAMAHQAEGALDAGAVANATIQTLRQVSVILTPVIGEVGGRSRNAGHPTPPAQIRTCATNAYGSYLECIPSNRLFGQGCTTLGCGSASRKN